MAFLANRLARGRGLGLRSRVQIRWSSETAPGPRATISEQQREPENVLGPAVGIDE